MVSSRRTSSGSIASIKSELTSSTIVSGFASKQCSNAATRTKTRKQRKRKCRKRRKRKHKKRKVRSISVTPKESVVVVSIRESRDLELKPKPLWYQKTNFLIYIAMFLTVLMIALTAYNHIRATSNSKEALGKVIEELARTKVQLSNTEALLKRMNVPAAERQASNENMKSLKIEVKSIEKAAPTVDDSVMERNENNAVPEVENPGKDQPELDDTMTKIVEAWNLSNKPKHDNTSAPEADDSDNERFTNDDTSVPEADNWGLEQVEQDDNKFFPEVRPATDPTESYNTKIPEVKKTKKCDPVTKVDKSSKSYRYTRQTNRNASKDKFNKHVEKKETIPLESCYVELQAEPKNMKTLSKKQLIKYIQKTLMPSFEEYNKIHFCNTPDIQEYYKSSSLCARKFIRYLQTIIAIDYEQGRDAVDTYQASRELNYKSNQENELNNDYLDCLARENCKRKSELRRILKTTSNLEDAKRYGKMTLVEMRQTAPRDGFSESNWIRPQNFKLFNKEIKYEDVTQGSIGNCWYLASLQSLAAREPGHIRDMIKPMENGLYEVRLYMNGVEQKITVDEFLPPFRLGAEHEHPRENSYMKDYDVYWPLLVEKAFAKYYDSKDYGVLIAQTQSLGISSFTSYPSMNVRSQEFREALFDFEKLQKYWNAGCLITMGERREYRSRGHAWAVVGLETSNGENYVHMSNPHNLKREVAIKKYKKTYKHTPVANMGFVEGTRSTWRVPFIKLGLAYKSMSICEYNTNLKAQHLKSSNRGRPHLGMDVFKITCRKGGKVNLAVFIEDIVLNTWKAISNKKDRCEGFLVALDLDTERVHAKWMYATGTQCKGHYTYGRNLNVIMDEKYEYYFLPYFHNKTSTPAASLNICIHNDSESEIAITKVSNKDELNESVKSTLEHAVGKRDTW